MSLLLLNYILAFVWIPVCKMLCKGNDTKATNLYLLIIGVQLFIPNAFKDWTVMPDLPIYEWLFTQYRDGMPLVKASKHFEPAYSALTWIVATNGGSLLLFSCIIAAFITITYLLLFKKYSAIPWISVILFFSKGYLMSFFILRQAIAIAVCLLSIKFILDRKLIPFLLTVYLATLFHRSAYFFFPAYFIYAIPMRRDYWIQYMIIAVLAPVMLHHGMQYMSSFLGVYDHYLDNQTADSGTTMTPALIAAAVLILTAVLVKVETLKGLPKLAFLMCSTSLLVNIAGIGIPLIPRLNIYYEIFVLFLIPYLISTRPQLDRAVYTSAILACYFMIYFGDISNKFFNHFRLIF